MQTLDTLKVYLLAKEFRKDVSNLVNNFPKVEKFSLSDQLKRSVRSITANIAEGYGRYNYQEMIQFFRMARGSLLETYDHLSSTLDEEYISEPIFQELKIKQEQLLQNINGYIVYLKRRKQER